MKFYVMNARTAARTLAAVLLVAVLVLVLGAVGMRAVGAFLVERQLPIYSVESHGNKAAITFDCAWGADDIPDILATLKKENVKATFFIVGEWAEKYPDKVKMISDEGHDVANHGYSHLRMGAMDSTRVQSEITDCSNALQKITGKKVDLFRPPYGDYSNNLVSSAKSLGCYTIQWNVDSLDWKPEIASSEILKRISTRLVPGSILLFHNDTKHTADMLGDIIALVKNSGYELVPVSELIIRDKYDIDFEGRQHPVGKQP